MYWTNGPNPAFVPASQPWRRPPRAYCPKVIHRVTTANAIITANDVPLVLSTGWQYCDAEWMVDGDNGLRTPLSSVSSPPPSTGKSGGGGGGAEDWASGWQYSVDFGGFQQNQGSSKKGMTHFVRRRKLVRTVQFDGELRRVVPWVDIDACKRYFPPSSARPSMNNVNT